MAHASHTPHPRRYVSSACVDRVDTGMWSERFIAGPLICGEAKLGSGGGLVVGAAADFDSTMVRRLSRYAYVRPS
jgi:hypothetical protein